MLCLKQTGLVALLATVAAATLSGQTKNDNKTLSDWVARKLAYQEIYKIILKDARLEQNIVDVADPNRPLDLEIACALVTSYAKDPKLLDSMATLMALALDGATRMGAILVSANNQQYVDALLTNGSNRARSLATIGTPPMKRQFEKLELERNERIIAIDRTKITTIAGHLPSARLAEAMVGNLASQIRAAIERHPDLLEPFAAEWPTSAEMQESRARVTVFLQTKAEH